MLIVWGPNQTMYYTQNGKTLYNLPASALTFTSTNDPNKTDLENEEIICLNSHLHQLEHHQEYPTNLLL